MLESLQQWDRELLVFLNNLGIETFDSFWIFVTKIESWTALFVFFTFLIFHFYKGKQAITVFVFALLSFGITLFLTELTKEWVARIRPNNATELVDLLRVLQQPNSHSFFSGHASTSFAITTFLVFTIRKYSRWIYLAYTWPLLFVSSRIYVGVHYPSDILVGALVGTFMAFLCYWSCFRMIRYWRW